MASVVDWGATGDGVTDDRTAIQNCIADALATGDEIIFPVAHDTAGDGSAIAPFKYRVSSALFVGNKHRLTFRGPGQILIDADQVGFIVNQSGGSADDVTFTDMNFSGGATAISCRGSLRTRIQNCRVEEFTEIGLDINSAGTSHNVVIQNCFTNSADGAADTIGIAVDATDSCVTGNVIIGSDVGIYVDANAVRITDNHIFTGLDSDGIEWRIMNYSIQLGEGANHAINIANNQFDNPATAFIDVNSAGGPWASSSMPPRDYDQGSGESIRIRGNIFLVQRFPETRKRLVIGGPANFHDNIVRILLTGV